MQRLLLLLLMLAGCGDGSRGGSLVAPIVPPPADGVDKGEAIDHGSGVDEGDGTPQSFEEFASCRRSADCSRGICAPTRGGEGVCLAICAQPPSSELERLPIDPCVGREQCVLTEGAAGVCLVACSSDTECPGFMECNRFNPSFPTNFCVPVLAAGQLD